MLATCAKTKASNVSGQYVASHMAVSGQIRADPWSSRHRPNRGPPGTRTLAVPAEITAKYGTSVRASKQCFAHGSCVIPVQAPPCLGGLTHLVEPS